MERKSLSTLAIMKKPGQKTEGPTLSSYLNRGERISKGLVTPLRWFILGG
jgi:hypothetical protein